MNKDNHITLTSEGNFMAKTLPGKALTSVSRFHGAVYPSAQRTGLFFTETLH